MKFLQLPILISFLFCSGLVTAEPPLPQGKRLREIVAKNYSDGNVYIGGTTGWRKMGRGSGSVLNREFSYATPENDFKQSTIHPTPNRWNWELADNWVKHCEKNKQVLRIHGPISPQCSKWTKDDTRTASELKNNLEEFMTAICKRYDKYKHVKWMDVVNETVSRDGSWFGPKLGMDKWENPWTILGFDKTHSLNPPLYIKMAFEIANKQAPNIKLIINQHGGMEKPMWDKVKALVPYLRKQGLRVDGIGWQAHIDVGWEQVSGNMKRYRELVKWAHANKLSFHVTEMNAWLKKDKDYEAQAKTFAAILGVLLENRDSGVVSWNVWNISDGDAWMKTKQWDGCILFEDFSPKPAYYALQKTLLNPPKTTKDIE